MIGFGALIFLAAFETDASSERSLPSFSLPHLAPRFLEEKLLVTAWLIRALGGDKVLPFPLKPSSQEFRYFLRQSPAIYSLYMEDHQYQKLKVVPSLDSGDGPYTPLWGSLHIGGAVCYL
jgi:hypothetical protein